MTKEFEGYFFSSNLSEYIRDFSTTLFRPDYERNVLETMLVMMSSDV